MAWLGPSRLGEALPPSLAADGHRDLLRPPGSFPGGSQMASRRSQTKSDREHLETLNVPGERHIEPWSAYSSDGRFVLCKEGVIGPAGKSSQVFRRWEYQHGLPGCHKHQDVQLQRSPGGAEI